MSSTYTEITLNLLATGSGALTYHTGYKPERVVIKNSDNVEATWYRADPGNTTLRAAAGTSSVITTGGISFDETTNTLSFGANAGLNGTAGKKLFVSIYK